jgi:hypothetical protein
MTRLKSLSVQRWIGTLSSLAALLVVANLAGVMAKFHWGVAPEHGWVASFDLDGERNVPSVFSTGLILLCAGLMTVIARIERGPNRRGWWGLAAIFVFLAADELVSLHERLIEPLRAALHTSGLLYFAWLIPYGLAVLVTGALYLRFLLRLPGTTRRRVIIAGVVYLTGAVGLELIGGAYLESLGNRHNLPYELLTTLEETLEMAGMILLARGLLGHWERLARRESPFRHQGHNAARLKVMASKGTAHISSSSL